MDEELKKQLKKLDENQKIIIRNANRIMLGRLMQLVEYFKEIDELLRD